MEHEVCVLPYTCYPKANRLKAKLVSVHGRFKNCFKGLEDDIKDVLTKKYQLTQQQQIEDGMKEIDRMISICVVGQSGRYGDLYQKPPPTDHVTHSSSDDPPYILVFILQVQQIDEHAIQNIKELLKNNEDMLAEVAMERVFLLCEIQEELDKGTSDLIKAEIHCTLKDYFQSGRDWAGNIIINPNKTSLSTEIAGCLEQEIIHVMGVIRYYLGKFIPSGPFEEDRNVADDLLLTLENFVGFKWGITDIVRRLAIRYTDDDGIASKAKEDDEHTEEDTSNTDDDEHVNLVDVKTGKQDELPIGKLLTEDEQLNAVVDELACEVVRHIKGSLQSKYHHSPELYDILLDEADIAGKVEKSLSPNTKSLMKRLTRYLQFESGYKPPAKTDKHAYIAERILHDIDSSSLIKSVANTIDGFKKVTDGIEKMVFEINTYLRPTTNVTEEAMHKENQRIVKMIKDIVKLDNVYGAGLIYGKLEVHLTKQDEEDKREIHSIARKHNYGIPILVKVVISKAVKFTRQGAQIEACIQGTLGCFAKYEQKLFAITCAHVVTETPFNQPLDVYCLVNGTKSLLGICTPNMSILPCQESATDITAVDIDSEVKNDCQFAHLTQNGDESRNVVVSDITPKCGTVYKRGAATGMTEGLLCSTSYVLRDHLHGETDENAVRNSIVYLVEDLPFSDRFAENGDSGAIVSASTDIDDSTVALISIVCEGNMMTGEEGCRRYLTYPFYRCVEKLQNKSRLQLEFDI